LLVKKNLQNFSVFSENLWDKQYNKQVSEKNKKHLAGNDKEYSKDYFMLF